MVYIFWTAANEKEAKLVARSLIENRLVACASIFPHITSIYRWKGHIEEAQEAKVILKTTEERFEAVKEFLATEGSYEVPEIAAVRIEKVHLPYLQWLENELRAVTGKK